MNEDYSQKVFDSLLEEAVTGRRPPDLSSKIKAAWELEKESGVKKPQLVQAELVLAPPPLIAAEIADSSIDSERPGLAVVSEAQQVVSKLRNRRSSRTRTILAAAASVAAAVFIVAATWKLVLNHEGSGGGNGLSLNSSPSASDPGNEVGVSTPAVDVGSASETDREAGEDSGLPSLALDGPVKGIESEMLDIQNLPFPESENAAIGQAGSEATSLVAASAVKALDNQEIISALDDLFGEMWVDAGVTPTQTLDAPELASKVFLTATGKVISPQLKQRISDASESFVAARFASRVLGTPQFREFWSSRLTKSLLRSASIAPAGDDSEVVREAIAKQLLGKWDQLPAELLAGDLANPSASNVFIKALGGADNHRLLQRVGNSFLDSNVGCARCHDDLQVNREAILNSQKSYWNLIALLKGLEAKGNANAGSRSLIDRQADLFAAKNPIVYYEQNDGNLRSASAAVPGVGDWKTLSSTSPRAALSAWIVNSQAFDRAVVNEAWRLVFGARLVDNRFVEASTGQDFRESALDLLARQFRAHDHNYTKMLGWIISSKPFARSAFDLSPEQWLASNDEELQAMKSAEVLFAADSSLGKGRESNSVYGSLAAALKWNGNSVSGELESTLAQPDMKLFNKPEKVRQALRRQAGMKIAMPSLGYILHGEIHADEKSRFVERIVDNASLDWRQKVEHIVGLKSVTSVVNDRFMDTANRVLSASNGDQVEALLTLLWSIENTEAQ